jgi:hypothetical protein
MMMVAYTASSDFRPSAPTLLWSGDFSAGNGASCGMPGVSSSNYDVTRDGQRFLMVKEQSGSTDGTKLVVVLNWTDRVKEMSRARVTAGRTTND